MSQLGTDEGELERVSKAEPKAPMLRVVLQPDPVYEFNQELVCAFRQLEPTLDQYDIGTSRIIERLTGSEKMFTLLQLVENNVCLEDILDYLQTSSFRPGQKKEVLDLFAKELRQLHLPSSYPSIPDTNYRKTQRFQQSLHTILQQALGQLRIQSQTRDRLCQTSHLDRRRLSSALSPLAAINLLVEPESYKVGTIGQPIVKERMPGVRLFRNYREEAVCCQVNDYIGYYKMLKGIRAELETKLSFLDINESIDLRFVGRRIDELAKRRGADTTRSVTCCPPS